MEKNVIMSFKKQQLVGALICDGEIKIRVTGKHPEQPLTYFCTVSNVK